MLTIKQCRDELKNEAKNLPDEEILLIRDFLYGLSELIFESIKTNENEKGNIVCEGINR
jgi:hypothetical protein